MKKILLFLIFALPLFVGAQNIRIQQLRSTGEPADRIIVTDGSNSFTFADLDTGMVNGLLDYVEEKTAETIDTVYVIGTVIYIQVKGKALPDTIELAPVINNYATVDSLTFNEGWFRLYQNGETVPDSVFIDIAGAETDPIFTTSIAAAITAEDTTRWGTNPTETDPIFAASLAAAITSEDTTRWGAGGTETDPVFTASLAAAITAEDTTRWGAGGTEADPIYSAWDKSTGISIPANQVSDFDTEVSNNTDVAANTAKTTNATHTGEVTGSGALTIADNVVAYSNVSDSLKSSATNNTLTWDISANGIIYCTPSTGTVSFTNAQVNKTLCVVLTLSSSTITWPATAKILNGSATLADGTFYVYIHCISSTIFTVSITKEAV